MGASPLKMLLMLTPPSASSPRPSDIRDSMSAASLGLLATTSRPASFSNQRNAGTPRLLPCSSPAWLAGVVGGTWACQGVRRWLPARIQRLRVGRLPETTAHCSSGAASPSIWSMTTPGSSWRGIRLGRENISSWLRNSVSSPGRQQPADRDGDDRREPGGGEGRPEAVDVDVRSHHEGDVEDRGPGEQADHEHARPSRRRGPAPAGRAAGPPSGSRPARPRAPRPTRPRRTGRESTLIVTISARKLIRTAATVAATRCRFQP